MNQPRLEHAKLLIDFYEVFKREFNPALSTIYYPSCGIDISASEAFPESRGIHVDIDQRIVDALKAHGLEAHCADAKKFTILGGVDAVILQNQSIPAQKPISNLKKGGYVLCNDYHGAATETRKRDGCNLVARIREEQKTPRIVVDRDNLGMYWEEVETDEEFMKAPFSFGGVESYDTAKTLVKLLTGKETDILSNYVKIIELAMQQQKLEREQMRETLGFESQLPLAITFEGRTYFLWALPRKRGAVDDLFVFLKTA